MKDKTERGPVTEYTLLIYERSMPSEHQNHIEICFKFNFLQISRTSFKKWRLRTNLGKKSADSEKT